MTSWFNLKTWLITLTMIVLAVAIATVITTYEYSGGITKVSAGGEHNVSGWAWSENFGWVSFNSTDCDANDDGQSDGTPLGCPPAGTAIPNYGVNIDATTGNFSEYGWSSNIGWIDFGPTAGYPEAPNTPAHYDSGTGAVTGWAKILSLGDDGWLKMSGSWTNGVTIDSAGDFHGWAWNGNSATGAGLGWLSFNCLDDSSCVGSNYKVNAVVNQAPSAINLSAFNWNYSQASQYGALRALLRWEFSDADPGSSQSAYQLIVSPYADFTSPIINTGKVAGSASQYSLTSDQLDYNTPYYWKIMVWDDRDMPSAWKNYDTTPDTDNDDGVVSTFTTYKHEMPQPDFTWLPAAPSQGEAVQFSDASKYYTGAAPSSPVNCDDANCDWLWTVPADAAIDNSGIANPIITFGSSGEMSVTLTVTDNDGYYTSLTKILDLKQKLPMWKEVKPK